MTHELIQQRISASKLALLDNIDNVAHFELTFAEYVERRELILATDKFAKLPRWAQERVSGYEDCYRHMKLETRPGSAILHALIYQGKLYRSYDHWRGLHPDTPGSELTEGSAAVYASGKIFSHFQQGEPSAYVGQTLPFAE